MSMNVFFRAFTQAEIEAMSKDTKLIDAWILENKKYSIATDVESAWDVLTSILDGVGFLAGEEIDNALFNGCLLISADEVKDHAEKLSTWTEERVLEGLRNIDPEADLYHLEFYQEEEDSLLEAFQSLVNFYREAAEKGLGAVSYAA